MWARLLSKSKKYEEKRREYEKRVRRAARRGTVDTKKLLNAMLIMMLIPTLLQTATSGDNPLLTVLMSFLPVLILLDCFDLDPQIKKFVNLAIILTLIPTMLAGLSSDNPLVQTFASLLPAFVIIKFIE